MKILPTKKLKILSIYKHAYKSIFKPVNLDNVKREYKDITPKSIKTSYRPRTINDMENLQKYIKTTSVSDQLDEDMYRESKKNKEFLEFFKTFKEKNKDKWASIINGMDVDVNQLAKETEEELAQKYKIYNEIHKRKQLGEGYETFNDIALKKLYYEKDNQTKENKYIKPTYKGFNEREKKFEERSDDLYSALAPDTENDEMYDSRKFTMIFLDADMVCNVTTLNRVYHRRCLLFAGNKEGMISYGVGVGLLYEDAYLNAFKELKKNLILIEWDPGNTCPLPIQSRFNDYRFKIKPTKSPMWFSGPIPLLMIRYAGLYHQNFIKESRNKHPYAMVFAFFKAVTQNTTLKNLAEEKGVKKRKLTPGFRYKINEKKMRNPQLANKL